MNWPADLIPALIIGSAFVLLIVSVEIWARRVRPNPEWPRKIVHMIGGAICLNFPLLFQSPWTVLALGVGMFLLISTGKRYQFLQSLHGVERKSKGAEYYPLMIFALFWLSHDTPWLYEASLLALAVADALAALVGGRYGRLRYQIDEEWKTVEGSLTFFIVAWCVISIPLLLSNDVDLPGYTHRIMVAGVAAILVTMLEAISRHGRDNIWIPLGTLLIISRLIDEPMIEAATQLGSILVLCLIVATSAAASRSMNVGATLALILAIYSGWALTSFDFVLPLMSGTILCMCVAYYNRPERPLRAASLLHMLLPIVLAAAAADLSELSGRQTLYQMFFASYVGGCVAITTQNVWDGRLKSKQRTSTRERISAIIISIIVACTLATPLWLRETGMTTTWFTLMFATAVLVCAIHKKLYDGLPPSLQKGRIVGRRYLSIVAAMSIFAAIHHFELLPPLLPGLLPT